jgi:hypothetical protein
MSPIFRRRRSSPDDLELANALEARSFFRYLEPEEAASAKAAVAKDGIDAIWHVETGRHFWGGDAEDLAEGGVAEWLDALRLMLDRLGLRLEDVEQDFGEDLYVVRVGGREYTIYDLAGADAAAAEDGALLWELSWTRALGLLNDLLVRVESRERAYAVSEWSIWFLTPELVELLPTEFGEASGT